MWLLNHAEDVLHEPAYKRSNHYGSEVQLHCLIWNLTLPSSRDTLERHEHLQVTADYVAANCFE